MLIGGSGLLLFFFTCTLVLQSCSFFLSEQALRTHENARAPRLDGGWQIIIKYSLMSWNAWVRYFFFFSFTMINFFLSLFSLASPFNFTFGRVDSALLASRVCADMRASRRRREETKGVVKRSTVSIFPDSEWSMFNNFTHVSQQFSFPNNNSNSRLLVGFGRMLWLLQELRALIWLIQGWWGVRRAGN